MSILPFLGGNEKCGMEQNMDMEWNRIWKEIQWTLVNLNIVNPNPR